MDFWPCQCLSCRLYREMKVREDTEQEKTLKREVERLEKLVAIHEMNVARCERVIAVLVAVGHVSREKVDRAREIVSDFE